MDGGGFKRDYPRSHDRGPIEAQRRRSRLPARKATIRGHMTAAPLKLSSSLMVKVGSIFYPRSHDRGPIEARPRLHWMLWWRRIYPRSHDRGPIEAVAEAQGESSLPGSIRGHMTAAPLKHQWRGTLPAVARLSAVT